MAKMKTLKRSVSLLLILATLCTVAAVFSGCGLFTKKTVGTEAAKILLAHERLDEDLIGQKLNIFSTSQKNNEEEDKPSFGGFFENLFQSSGFSTSSLDSPSLVGASASGVTVNSDSVTWSSFKDASELKASYVQFIEPIDRAAADTAKLIAKIKADVGVTNKWIDAVTVKYMLIVEEDSETIIEYDKTLDVINVSTRYTTDDAKCVYEMYSFLDYEDGTSGEVRNKCIPGEYYEYTYRNSGGFNDYFIADNSRGYWMMNRFSFHLDYAFFDMAAVKGDIGYGIGVNSHMAEDGRLVSMDEGISASIFSPNVDRDLLTINNSGDGYEISIYMTNVQSGIASLSAPSDAYEYHAEYGHINDVYLTRDEFGIYNGVKINLANGKTISAGQLTDKIIYNGAIVDYNMFFGEETYTGKLGFKIRAESEKEAYTLLTDYLRSQGVTLKATAQEINESYAHCELLHENFDVMEWYGLPMSSLDNLEESENRLIRDFKTYREKYEKVKDSETISSFAPFVQITSFGALTVTSQGSASYSGNGIIRIDGLVAHTEDSELFEDGVKYSLKLGLARLDENGQYRSANTVTLEANDGTESFSEYMDKELELTLSGEYSLPAILSEGEYVVVVYYATSDEGIRVTEMAPVAFYSADEGRIETNFKLMDVTVKKVGENLHVTYAVSLSDSVTADVTKTSYTYEEIERILVRGILAKGYPISEAVVQNEKGEALTRGESYGAGTYRLKYLVNTSEGLVEAYMYTTLK